MSAKILIDRERCQGYGNCALASEGHFDLDDEGLVVLVKQVAEQGELAAVRRAVYDCPTDALSLVGD